MKFNLDKKFPKDILRIIETVTETAGKEGFSMFIVGGIVRDLLLNVPNYDLDFVIEGDAVRFSKILNKKLNGPLKTYPAFKTATILYKHKRIDLATARKETYKKPASYPNVKPGTIKEDLFRRDFTINAMALSLSRDNFGELVDFYNGVKDLQKGLIRILHNKSFIDDPTRIFRAVRFAARYDFKIEKHTEVLIKKAVLNRLLGEVNRGRIKKEVELSLKEKNPVKCLEGFSKLLERVT